MSVDARTSVAAVILAAGASTRFGANKLLLKIGGESLVRRAARAALDAGLDPVVVVLGHDAGRVQGELGGLRVLPVLNPEFARGMSSSLRAGIAALPSEVGAMVVQLADMPRVTAEMLARLVERFIETGAPIVASDYGGVHAPPTLYARSLFGELRESEGDGVGKRVVGRHEAEVVRVPFPPGALADVDRAEDWERLCATSS
ncbi:MAG TPA: nucleotidyltransferase family protein [Thermoanaerobaculia bacterium]|jgi:molybdenum cofactor cytidylyltransferase|nr:nucleotidyltransferase family protein [Thermoanaerobaculia bacterium]